MINTIGFVGTGAISEAIIRGLLDQPNATSRIIVSPRNRGNAERLARYYEAVRIAANNQAVVDDADILILAVMPQIAEEVIRALEFKPGQQVVSVIAATELQRLRSWIKVDVQITQAIPLPFVVSRNGVTAIYPANKGVAEFFDFLGTAVVCESKVEFDLLAAASALMSAYFGIMKAATDWLVDRGLSQQKARSYVAPMFASLSQSAASEPLVSFEDLRRSFATKGGLNEQVLQDFEKFGGTEALKKSLDRVLTRIRG